MQARRLALQSLFLKQIRECLPGVSRPGRRRFAFYYRSGREQFAIVARLLVDYPRGDRLPAFEPRAGIKEAAHAAGVKTGFTFGTFSAGTDVGFDGRSARGTLHLLTKGHHSRRTRALAFTPVWLWFRTLFALAVVVHITALPIFPLAHVSSFRRTCRHRPSQDLISESPKSRRLGTGFEYDPRNHRKSHE